MAESIPNHTVDPKTGFLESNGFALAFDAADKVRFLELYKQNGLKARNTCRQMGIAEDTLYRHLRVDEAFKRAFEGVRLDYIEELEATSRTNALQPKAVIERIFQLKALLPDKYGDTKSSGSQNITINISAEALEKAKERSKIIDAQIVDSQQERVLIMSDKTSPISDHEKPIDNQR